MYDVWIILPGGPTKIILDAPTIRDASILVKVEYPEHDGYYIQSRTASARRHGTRRLPFSKDDLPGRKDYPNESNLEGWDNIFIKSAGGGTSP